MLRIFFKICQDQSEKTSNKPADVGPFFNYLTAGNLLLI